MKKTTKTSLILRIAASLYLLYLAWELKDAPASHIGVESILFIIAIIIFTLVAVVMGGLSIKAYVKGEYADTQQDDSKDNT
jgi:uncharacterized membrane protein